MQPKSINLPFKVSEENLNSVSKLDAIDSISSIVKILLKSITLCTLAYAAVMLALAMLFAYPQTVIILD